MAPGAVRTVPARRGRGALARRGLPLRGLELSPACLWRVAPRRCPAARHVRGSSVARQRGLARARAHVVRTVLGRGSACLRRDA